MRHGEEFLTVLVLIALTIALGLGGWRCESDARQRCVTTGGRIAEVHGGRGGWVCLRQGER